MFGLLRKYLKKHVPELLINMAFLGLQVFIQVFLIIRQMKAVIDQGISAGDMGQIMHSCGLMAVYTVLAILCTVVTSFMSGRIVAGAIADLRHDCMRKIYALSPQDFVRFGSASLVTRVMTDTLQLETLLINLTRSSMMVFFAIIAMLILIYATNPMLATLLLAAFLATNLFMIHRGAKVKPRFERIQKLTERLNRLFLENLSGARTIRAFRNEAMEEEKIATASAEVYDANVDANQPINYVSPIALIIMNWVVIVIYLFGAGQVRGRIISLSDLMLIINYLAYFISSFTVISVIVNLVPKVSVSSARIMELLDYTPDMEPDTLRTGIQRGEIEFHDVGFGYSDAGDVISHVSFRAKAGETTAIIGGTGSGKTTLLNLLQGIIRMTSGDILIDGTSIRDLDPTYLLGRISYASQKALIFQDTIRANLTAYDDTICEERIEQALVAACFDEVVKELPQGLDTRMAQGGMNLSGGQRQRLCLARTLAKDAPIYIFDDALSSLDAQTEQRVVSAMRAMTAGRTVLIVSQKISAVREADHIVVLDDGRIVGDGTHWELLDTCPEYRQIYQIQCYNEGKRDAQ